MNVSFISEDIGMKKTWSFVTTALVCAVLLAGVGCSKKEAAAANAAAAGDKITLTIVYATGNQTTTDLMHARVEAFMKANPNITLVEKLSNEGAYLDTLRTLDSVGELPDIIEMRDTPAFVRANKLGVLPEDITSLFKNTVQFNSNVYTAPYESAYPIGIVYSKDVFEKLGINVEDIKTYSDFLTVCQKIKDSGTPPIVAGDADIWHMGYWWSSYWLNHVFANNPNWIADRYAGKVSFTDPEVKAAMEGLADLFAKGYVEQGWASTGEGQAPSVLVAGRAAMYYVGPFAFQQIDEADPEFQYGFFAIPNNEGKHIVTGGPTAAGWAINAKTQENPVKAKAVYDFIKFFFSKDVYTDYLKTGRFFNSLKENIVYESTPQMEDAQRIEAGADQVYLNWNQYVGESELPPNFRNYCYKLCSEWFLGQSTVDEGLKAMDREWENASKDFNPVLKPQQ
jgi:raffinose/stachyose/melibiose transport system substrate-binding protein